MQFLKYLGEKQVLPQNALSTIRDSAAIAQKSPYQYIYERCGTGDEILSYDRLAQNFKDSLRDEGIEIVEIKETRHWHVFEDFYRDFGGISERLAQQIIPLVNDAGEHLAISATPDDMNSRARIANAYKETKYKLGILPPIARMALWRGSIEPLLVSQIASQVVASSDTAIGISDEASSSAARILYQRIINIGIQERASDVHFIPCTYGVEVHFRIDGVNVEYGRIQKEALERIKGILKTDGKIPETKPYEPIDGKVRFSPSNNQIPNDEIDLRVSIIPSKGGPDLNIRYLSEKLYTFEEIGMSETNIQAYKHLLDLPSGLVVQVGPTGSGKSTTLYAGLEYVHKSLRNIMTAEDPVEILMDGISQIDVDNDKRLSFSQALKASLRHDPDVIVVGELRDAETAALAVRAANTGHLVLTSLHTNDAIGCIERLVNLEVDPYSLGEVLAAVMGQRLVRRLCPFCSEEYELDLQSPRARLFGLPHKDGTMTFRRACGCVKCNNSGYKGRIAINEIMPITPELRDLIQKHAPRREYEEALRKMKFRTMYQDGIAKAIKGITSLEEMEKFANDTIAFKG